jgi:enterochelin esterase family protein
VDPAAIESAVLRRLVSGDATLNALWRHIETHGAPLVEPVPDQPDQRLVSFVFRSRPQTRNVVVVGGPAGYDAPEQRMQRLGDTDLWFRSYHVPRDTRCCYQLSENDALIPPWETTDPESATANWQPDSLNRRRCEIVEVEGSSRGQSLLELPHAPHLRYGERRSDVPQGTLEDHRITSAVLGNTRGLRLYTPHSNLGPPRALLIVFDGVAFTHTVPTPTILDNLIAEGCIPATAALFVDSLGEQRNRELPCRAPFATAVARELLPWMKARCGEHPPQRVVLAGASYGGVASAYVARAHPELFGNVLSLSGSFWVKGNEDADRDFGWLPRRYAQGPALPLRFYQAIGLFEQGARLSASAPDQLGVNRLMRDVLLRQGYDSSYREYPGGHDYICWEEYLPQGLTFLLSP